MKIVTPMANFINHYIAGKDDGGDVYVTSDYVYENITSVGFSIRFNLVRGTSPVYGLYIPFKLYSGESVSLSLPFELAPASTSRTYSYTSTGGARITDGAIYALQSIAILGYSWAKWSAECLFDNVNVSSYLNGRVVIEYEEDASTIANVTIIPPSGVIDPLVYVGKEIQLIWKEYNTNNVLVSSRRRFYGAVSDVSWDTDKRIINITADTQLPAYFNDLTKEQIEAKVGGLWSDKIWDDESDSTGWTHAQERLSTTETCVWHDANWQLQVTDIKAKRSGGVIIPDFEYTDDERFHETLKLEYAQRSEMINEIRIDLNYRYQRKRERQIIFKWQDLASEELGHFFFNCDNKDLLQGPYNLCQRSMVESAATSGDWIAINNITYTDLWPAGAFQYACPGGRVGMGVWGWKFVDLGPSLPDKTIIAVDGSKQTVRNPDALQVGYSIPDYSSFTALCRGATWKAARRWLQDVDEYYELIVKAPDSIESIGEVVTTEEYSIQNEEDNAEWPDSIIPFNEQIPGGGWSTMPGSRDYYLDADSYAASGTFNRDEFNDAQEVVLAAAKGDIIRAHRLTTVSFQVAYQPDLTLAHTIKVNTPYLTAEGKVKSTRDTWDIDTGEASTEINVAISRHNGSGLYTNTDPLTAVDRPDPTTETPIERIHVLESYIGGRSLTPGNEALMPKWNDTNFPPDEIEGFFTNFIDNFAVKSLNDSHNRL